MTSSPCTILLRIDGGNFDKISDAAVIENGDHLFYEKPVGNVVVLDESSHKVLYIMRRDVVPAIEERNEVQDNKSNISHHFENNDNKSKDECENGNCVAQIEVQPHPKLCGWG